MSGELEATNMRLIGHNDLGDYGHCGEGVAMHIRNGRRTLFIAQVDPPGDFTAVDVTDPREPQVIGQTQLPHDQVRSNSLMIVGDTMAVCRQASKAGEKPAGLEMFDVSDPANPRSIGFWDASGPESVGTHYVWYVDGEYAYLSSGAPDFDPVHMREAQIVVILDVKDATKPHEVGRWWLPGTSRRDGFRVPTIPERLAEAWGLPAPERGGRDLMLGDKRVFDAGSRAHDVYVYPQRPNRCYVSYIDSGVVILDVSDKSRPTEVGSLNYAPPSPGFTHTAMPLFAQELLAITEECVNPDWIDHPKQLRFADMSYEKRPMLLSIAPMPGQDRYPGHGRYGAHNIYDNPPVAGSWQSERYVVGAFFGLGIRAYDVSDPYEPKEVGAYVPAAPEGAPAIQMNDLHIDENGLIYALDRVKGGVYVLEFTP